MTKKINASIAVLSCLQDAINLINNNNGSISNKKINFAQYLIFQCSGNLNQEIDVEYYKKKYDNIDIDKHLINIK